MFNMQNLQFAILSHPRRPSYRLDCSPLETLSEPVNATARVPFRGLKRKRASSKSEIQSTLYRGPVQADPSHLDSSQYSLILERFLRDELPSGDPLQDQTLQTELLPTELHPAASVAYPLTKANLHRNNKLQGRAESRNTSITTTLSREMSSHRSMSTTGTVTNIANLEIATPSVKMGLWNDPGIPEFVMKIGKSIQRRQHYIPREMEAWIEAQDLGSIIYSHMIDSTTTGATKVTKMIDRTEQAFRAIQNTMKDGPNEHNWYMVMDKLWDLIALYLDGDYGTNWLGMDKSQTKAFRRDLLPVNPDAQTSIHRVKIDYHFYANYDRESVKALVDPIRNDDTKLSLSPFQSISPTKLALCMVEVKPDTGDGYKGKYQGAVGCSALLSLLKKLAERKRRLHAPQIVVPLVITAGPNMDLYLAFSSADGLQHSITGPVSSVNIRTMQGLLEARAMFLKVFEYLEKFVLPEWAKLAPAEEG